jgi:polysaccharide biosynthesis transport protein
MRSNRADEIIELRKTYGADVLAPYERDDRFLPSQPTAGRDYEVERTDEIDLRLYLEKVWRNKLLVAVVTILLTTIAGAFVLTRESVYQAQARVQVDYDNNGTIAGPPSEPTTFGDRAYFNTQLELLTSPNLIRRAVKKLEKKSPAELASAGPPASVRLIPDVTQLTQGTSASASQPAAVDGLSGAGADNTAPYVAAIKESLTVQPVLKARQAIKDTRLIDIIYTHPDPEVCALVANALADELVEMNLDKKVSTNAMENKYLNNNIAELREKIRHGEEQLLGYGRNYQLPTLEGSQNTVVERLVGLNRQLLEAENERKQAEAAYKTALDPATANSMSEEGQKQIADIDDKLDELRQRRGLLLVEVTEKYPEVQEVDGQIAILEQQSKERRARAANLYKTNAETRYRQALAKEEAIRRSFEEQRGATLDQNEAAINYRIIQQGIETNKKLLDSMTQRSTENEMLRAKVPNNINVVDYASAPAEPVDKKNLQYLALAFMFSLSTGIGLAFLRDYFNTGVRSADEVERAIHSPTLAVVPGAPRGLLASTRNFIAPNQLRLLEGSEQPFVVSGGKELILNSDAQSPVSEAFRRLRTALLLSPSLGVRRKILVTSSGKGEGKTTTSINIATSLARAGVKVLLIDADLRNPRLHKVFSLNNSTGLTELLTSQVNLAEHHLPIASIAENFDILTAGTISETSAERLGSGNFDELLEFLSKIYDHIIIDSPPVTTFADSTVIASMVDGVLMVVQGNRNSQEAVRHSARMLRMVGATIVGVVLNRVTTSHENYYGYYPK